jgi:hypothetical protein
MTDDSRAHHQVSRDSTKKVAAEKPQNVKDFLASLLPIYAEFRRAPSQT